MGPRRRGIARSDTVVAVRVLWRSLLVWLMALALPVQGLAAAGSLHGAPLPDRVHLQARAIDAEVGHAQAHHRAADTAADTAAAAHDHGDRGHTCSACAACCPAIGLPSRAVDLPSAPIGGFAAEMAQPAGTSFVPAGLERPPRA